MTINLNHLNYVQAIKPSTKNQWILSHYLANHKDRPEESYEILESFNTQAANATLLSWSANLSRLSNAIHILPTIESFPNNTNNTLIFKHSIGHTLSHYIHGPAHIRPNDFDLIRIFYTLSKALSVMHQNGVTHDFLNEDNVILVSENHPYAIKNHQHATTQLVNERKNQTKILMPKLKCLEPSDDHVMSLDQRILRDINHLKSLIYISLVGEKPLKKELAPHQLEYQNRLKAWNQYRDQLNQRSADQESADRAYQFLKQMISTNYTSMDQFTAFLFDHLNWLFQKKNQQIDQSIKERIEFRNTLVKYTNLKRVLMVLYKHIDRYTIQKQDQITLCEEQMIHLFDMVQELYLIKRETDKLSHQGFTPMHLDQNRLDDLDKFIFNSKHLVSKIQSQPPQDQSFKDDFLGVKLDGMSQRWRELSNGLEDQVFNQLQIFHPNLKNLEEQLLGQDSQIKITDLMEVIQQSSPIKIQNSLTPHPIAPMQTPEPYRKKEKTTNPVKEELLKPSNPPHPSWIAYGGKSPNSSQRPPVSNVDISSIPAPQHIHEDLKSEENGTPTKELSTIFADELIQPLSAPTALYQGINVHQPLPDYSPYHTYEQKPIKKTNYTRMILLGFILLMGLVFQSELYHMGSIVLNFYKDMLQSKVDSKKHP